MKYCPKCRNKLILPDFCVECGADLSEYLKKSEESSFGSFGGIDFSSLESEAQRQLEEREKFKDFEIENGVIKKYKGNGGRVVIPKEIVSVQREAFWGSEKALTDIVFEDNSNFTSFASDAFYGFGKEINVYITDLTAWCRGSICIYANKLNLYLNGKPITCLEIPDGIYAINKSAFSGFSFTSVRISNSVTSIGDFAFSSCRSLTNIVIPNSVKTIGYDAFGGCSALPSISLPSGLISIGDSAFTECHSLTSITIPDGVTSIGSRAFAECSNLTNVTIPGSVTSIDVQVFFGCSNLRSVTIKEGVKMLNRQMFDGCRNLTSVSLPNSLTDIKSHAFVNCSSLSEITIPDGVITIESSAFQGCSALKHVTFGRNSRLTYNEASNVGTRNLKTVKAPARLAAEFSRNRYYYDYEIITY